MNLNDPSVRGKYYEEFFKDISSKLRIKVDTETLTESTDIEFGVIDPRCENLGFRIYCLAENTQNFADPKEVEISDEDNYDILRYLYGIPQWTEVAYNVPGRVNFDLLNSVELSKGCFLGQELTARAHHTGIVRKRPFLMVASTDPIGVSRRVKEGSVFDALSPAFPNEDFKGKSLKNSKGKKVGSIIGMLLSHCSLRKKHVSGEF